MSQYVFRKGVVAVGHVRKRGNVWYGYFDAGKKLDGSRNQKCVRLPDATGKRDAEKQLAKLVLQYEERHAPLNGKTTVAQYMPRWYEAMKSQWEPSTQYNYKRQIERFIVPRLGHIKLCELTPIQIQQLYTDLMDGTITGKPQQASSVHVVHTILHSSLKRAVLWEYIPSNPAARVIPPKPKKVVDRKVLDEKDTIQFLQRLRAYRPELFVPMMLITGTGIRRSEVLALRWSDVDLDKKRIYTRRIIEKIAGKWRIGPPKTPHSVRILPISDSLVSLLREHKVEQEQRRKQLGKLWHDNDLVCDYHDGSFWHPNTFSNAIIYFANRNGYERITPHSFRHGHASHLNKAGVSMKAISERLGHADIRITGDIYTHMLSGMPEEAAEKVDAMLNEAKKPKASGN